MTSSLYFITLVSQTISHKWTCLTWFLSNFEMRLWTENMFKIVGLELILVYSNIRFITKKPSSMFLTVKISNKTEHLMYEVTFYMSQDQFLPDNCTSQLMFLLTSLCHEIHFLVLLRRVGEFISRQVWAAAYFLWRRVRYGELRIAVTVFVCGSRMLRRTQAVRDADLWFQRSVSTLCLLERSGAKTCVFAPSSTH